MIGRKWMCVEILGSMLTDVQKQKTTHNHRYSIPIRKVLVQFESIFSCFHIKKTSDMTKQAPKRKSQGQRNGRLRYDSQSWSLSSHNNFWPRSLGRTSLVFETKRQATLSKCEESDHSNIISALESALEIAASFDGFEGLDCSTCLHDN